MSKSGLEKILSVGAAALGVASISLSTAKLSAPLFLLTGEKIVFMGDLSEGLLPNMSFGSML